MHHATRLSLLGIMDAVLDHFEADAMPAIEPHPLKAPRRIAGRGRLSSAGTFTVGFADKSRVRQTLPFCPLPQANYQPGVCA